MYHESGFKWDERSQKVLATLVPELRLVMVDALRLSDVPFQLVEGARTIERQRELFTAGKSKINPDAIKPADLYSQAKHVVGPGAPLSRAVDIVCSTPNQKYETHHLSSIAGAVIAVARMRNTKIRWGGNWDRDNEIITDQTFDDLPHFEVIP